MRRIPSTTGLQAFEAASRHLSFQKAADELNVTPGAVSRQIHALETLLGVNLFQRHHKRVALTSAGRHYADEIRAPLQRLADVSARLSDRAHGDALSICTNPSFAIRWFIPRWGRFYDAHPHIDLQLTTSLNPVDFESGAHHLAIQVTDSRNLRPGLASELLLEVDTFPVCAPELAPVLHSEADLAGQTLLHGEPRPSDWPRWLAAAGMDGRIDGSAGLRFESLNLAIQAAIEGLGVAIGVGCLIEEDLAAGRLVRVFEATRRSSRPFHLVYPEVRRNDPDLTALRDWLLKEAGRSSSQAP